MKRKKSKKALKEVQSLSHPKAKRKNIPTARHQPLKPEEQQKTKRIVCSHPHFNLSQALRDAFQTRDVDMDLQSRFGKAKKQPSLTNSPPIRRRCSSKRKSGPKELSTISCGKPNNPKRKSKRNLTCSPTSTDCRTATPKPSFTNTKPTGTMCRQK